MRFTSSLAVGALTALASAQTFTSCDPTKKDNCPNDPAMPATLETDFTKGSKAVTGWKMTAGELDYSSKGAGFTINKKGDAPTIQSETNLLFGYVEVKASAAPGQGIISSIVLESDDLDEVDWEFIGTDTANAQTNYYGKGNTTTYDRMLKEPVSNTNNMHTYALNWTKDALTWIIDEKPVRTLKYADAVGGKNYPQTPCTIRIGIWAGGDPDNNKGTIEWAGGVTDYTKGPYTMVLESVKVTNYSPGKEYKWTDKTGSYQSIQVIDAGNKNGSPQNSAVIASGSASATGAPIYSAINVPTGSAGGQFAPSGSVGGSSTCTDEIPTPTPIYQNSTSTSCSCNGIKTVIITGTPPPPPPVVTPTPVSSNILPPPPPPPVTNPPYPTTTGGLLTDTSPAPSVPMPSAPTGALPPVPKNTTGPAPSQYTGAASAKNVPAFIGLAAAAMLMV